MDWLLGQTWFKYTVVGLIIVVALTVYVVFLAAFESEHYTNSRFRAGKKISFKQALRNNLIGLYTGLILIALSWYGVMKMYQRLDTVRNPLWIGVPLLAIERQL